ncbi:DUF3309 family protein [Ferrovibrio terrae]|uniref:DUF3309 family protein n=2 Tax=Ferrovibrio terrae TaxID=2594003 RepID=A0A516H3X1_9PROT|nr:DUF3309 family protein [Ferrovibrio terrae]
MRKGMRTAAAATTGRRSTEKFCSIRNAGKAHPLDSRHCHAALSSGAHPMLPILAIMLILLLLVLPVWPYSRYWSIVPGCMIAFVMMLFVMFMLAGNVTA